MDINLFELFLIIILVVFGFFWQQHDKKRSEFEYKTSDLQFEVDTIKRKYSLGLNGGREEYLTALLSLLESKLNGDRELYFYFKNEHYFGFNIFSHIKSTREELANFNRQANNLSYH